jgi:TPR repeat protein
MYWIHEYEAQGTKPKEFLVELYKHHDSAPYANATHVYAPVTEKLNLEAQYRLGKAYGLYTPSNLVLLRKGNAAVGVKTPVAGGKTAPQPEPQGPQRI